ncbi:mRNA capping enzyme, alpha subunit [Acrodontium crateriforme]|uniref:mRNA-capping enzyme subunit alpha n=1 Tax=Acrodontium crateriforme TaxID=150365 RepID=A0AAQ3MCY7_9PEZI|nr:mRNA capping enzyme, alpha subunit [Acrodontium crateriforme]
MGSSIDLTKLGQKLSWEDADFYRNSVSDLLQRPNKAFPGAQPVSFARRHLIELTREDYFLCEKTDGIRCLLYCTQHFAGPGQPPTEIYFLIDRKNDYYGIEPGYLHLPRPNADVTSFHPNTILDGEIVKDRFPNGTEQITYLIFDCLAMDGQSVMNRPFDIRIGKINELIYKPWKAFAKDWPDEVKVQPFQIALKKMELPYACDAMFREFIPKLTHGNDGLIFTCLSTPYLPGTDEHILKWKPPHENTIDFRLHIADFPMLEDEDGPYEDYDACPQMDLYVNHGGNRGYQVFAALHVTAAEWNGFKSLGQQLDGRVIECYRDASTGNWRPKMEDNGTPRFRDDKKDANHISTVNSVLESIEDAVSEQDLIAQKDAIRGPYKQRAAEKMARKAAAARRPPPGPPQAHSRPHANQEEKDDGPTYED